MMTALPWLKATALAGRGAESLRVVDVVVIVATVVVAALVSARCEAPLAESDPLAPRGDRS